ncbi:MAG: hypothetical protein DRP78_02005 [Candidatus Omnitrophota bacterium]|nr:MAG: hypothetical protein DRP78_02005 [Candidatus Omnitrophota bacterium]
MYKEFKKLVSVNQSKISLVLVIFVLSAFYLPLLKNISHPVDNSDYIRTYYRLGLLRKICLEYKQLPQRNPFLSGGFPILGDAYVSIFNPFSVLALIFGEVRGVKLIIFIVLLFCAMGMFYLTRYVLRYNCAGSIFSTLVFMLCSWSVFQIKDGNYEKIYYYLLPWLLSFLIKSVSNRKFIIFASFIFGLVVIETGLGIVPITFFFVLFAFVNVKIHYRCKKLTFDFSYFKSLILILLFTCLFFATKILSTVDLLKMRSAGYVHFVDEHSYAVSSYLSIFYGHAMNFPSLIRALLDNSYVGMGQMYLGIIPCIFFLLSIIVFAKENLRYLIILIVFTMILFGSNSQIDLFKLLWQIHPFVHGIWRINKYFSIFVFFLIALIGGKLFLFPQKLKKFKVFAKFILLVVGIAGVVNMFNINKQDFNLKYIDYPEIKKVDHFFQVKVKEYVVAGPFDDDISDEKVALFYWLSMRQGFGITNSILGGNFVPINTAVIPQYFIDNKDYDELKQCGSVCPIEGKKENVSYKGEVFFLAGKNKAKFKYFSPNSLIIKVDVNNPSDILYINQRFDPSWVCDTGKILNSNGLLAVQLRKKGNYQIRLRYISKPLLLGFGLNIIGLAFAFYLYTKKWRK